MKQIRRSPATAALSLLVSTVVVAVACGCSSVNGASPSDAGHDLGSTQNDTAAPADAGHDLGSVQDTAAASACPPRPDLAAAAPTCSNVVNSAIAIPFTPATGTAPTPTGGVLIDGLYESASTGTYGATTGGGRRITFVILEGGTRMLWNGEVLDASGTTVQASFRADTSISVSGTRITFTLKCASSTPSPIPAALDFSVSENLLGTNLVLSLASGNTVAVTTYTRRGCAP